MITISASLKFTPESGEVIDTSYDPISVPILYPPYYLEFVGVVDTADMLLNLGDVGPGLVGTVLLVNLSATSELRVGFDGANYPFGAGPGEPVLFEWDSASFPDIHIISVGPDPASYQGLVIDE